MSELLVGSGVVYRLTLLARGAIGAWIKNVGEVDENGSPLQKHSD